MAAGSTPMEMALERRAMLRHDKKAWGDPTCTGVARLIASRSSFEGMLHMLVPPKGILRR